MDDNFVGDATVVLKPEEILTQHEVAGAANGKKFSYSLNKTQ
jgi:hypothetical protein